MKKVKFLKILITIIIIILVIQLFYLLYFFFFAKDNKFYFDGVNSIANYEDTFVTVGSNNDNTKYFEKAKVSSFDRDFNKTKEKLYNNEFDSSYLDLVMDEDSVVTVGFFEENRKDHNNDFTKALLVKYDNNGNVLFEKNFGSLEKTSFTSIINDNYYYATGYSHSKDKKEGGAYLLKLDKTNGNIKWEKNYGKNEYATYNDLVKIDNYIYTVGLSDKNTGIIAKYNLDGKLISTKKYKDTDSIGFSSITYDDDYLYVVGCKKDDNKKALLIKYDYNLEKIDEITYDGDNSRYNKVIVDLDKVIVIGINKNDNYTGLIGMYTKDLEEIDIVSYGDDEDTYFTDLIKVDDNYVVCGYSSYK